MRSDSVEGLSDGSESPSATLHSGADRTSPLNDPPRPDKHGGTPEWLLRITIESILIVTSILFALAVDGMRENRRNHGIALQSLDIFQREICVNRRWVEDGLPYHIGLRDVIAEMAGDASKADEVRSMVEGLEPVILQRTAWETALATGALSHMELLTVSGLSLTYNMQEQFLDETGAGLPRMLVIPSATPQERVAQVDQSLAYLNNLVRTEQRLQAVYNEAIVMIQKAADIMRGRQERSPIRTAVSDTLVADMDASQLCKGDAARN